MGENVSFKFAYLADSSSPDLSKMELTNATILGDKGFSPLFLMNTRKTQIFSYKDHILRFTRKLRVTDLRWSKIELPKFLMRKYNLNRAQLQPAMLSCCQDWHLEELHPWVKPL